MTESADIDTWLHKAESGKRCALIGEVAQAHDGSLGLAHAYIDAIADAGATAVKFQTHIASAESTPAEPWRKPFSPQDRSRYDYWRRMEFTSEQWLSLKTHAERRHLLFLSSPFSVEAFEMLNNIGVAAWKVASGEISNPFLIDAMLSTGQPILLSTGMSPLQEIDAVVQRIRASSAPLAVMQCNSLYPCPPEQVGLNILDLYRERYGTAVGLSDHSGTIFPALAAATLNAAVVEVHVTLSREMFGPDVCASVTTDELKLISEGFRFIDCMRRHPVDKSFQNETIPSLRRLFMKSIVAGCAIPAGKVIDRADLAFKKPGNGLPAEALNNIVGRRARRDLCRDECLSYEDLE